MKLSLSSSASKYDGISMHHATVTRILSMIGDVTLTPDLLRSAPSDMDEFDFVFRYGWPENLSKGYSDANFSHNLSSDPEKNILVAPFCVPMLSGKAINQIEAQFRKIIYDSTLSQEHGNRVLPHIKSAVINPVLHEKYHQSVDLPKVKGSFRYLHISNGLYWIKGVDILVDAFLSEFSSNDKVSLCLVMKNQYDMFSIVAKRFRDQRRERQLQLIENSLSVDELLREYANADCYVCVSRYDTFSLPTLEAAVCGLTVIAHEKCGVRDYHYGFHSDQYIPLATQNVMVPAGIWRNNKSILYWEPTKSSVSRALRFAYQRGRRSRFINRKLINDFGNHRRGLAEVKELLR